MRVGIQAKHIVFQSGGNSTYARNLLAGLSAFPNISAQGFGPARRPGSFGRLVGQSVDAIWPLANRSLDILHFTSDTGPVFRGSNKQAIVTTVHGLASAHVEGIRSPVSERIWRARVQQAINCSDHVITVSESSRLDIMEHFGVESGRITAIPHGIDHSLFRPADRTRPPKLSKGHYVLYVGNLEPRKNLVGAIKAFELSGLVAEGWKFIIVGRKAWRFDEILRAIDQTPGVRYLGYVATPCMVDLMQHAAGFFFPSLYEGFGLPPLEAMACGVPVVTSARGALGEVVGDAGLLVDPKCTSAMADGLQRLVDPALRATLARSGMERAATFRWERSVQSHVEIYNEYGNR